jgi:hypothetical protein
MEVCGWDDTPRALRVRVVYDESPGLRVIVSLAPVETSSGAESISFGGVSGRASWYSPKGRRFHVDTLGAQSPSINK